MLAQALSVVVEYLGQVVEVAVEILAQVVEVFAFELVEFVAGVEGGEAFGLARRCWVAEQCEEQGEECEALGGGVWYQEPPLRLR